MVTLQAEPHAAAEIAEIAWIDPTAPGGIEFAPLAEQTVFWPIRKVSPAFRQGMSRSSS